MQDANTFWNYDRDNLLLEGRRNHIPYDLLAKQLGITVKECYARHYKLKHPKQGHKQADARAVKQPKVRHAPRPKPRPAGSNAPLLPKPRPGDDTPKRRAWALLEGVKAEMEETQSELAEVKLTVSNLCDSIDTLKDLVRDLTAEVAELRKAWT